MTVSAFDLEAADIAAGLPAGPRLAIIGSTSFWHPESEQTCAALGRVLADVSDLVLLTGGVEGVGEAVGRSFWGACGSVTAARNVFHVLPRGCGPWDYGATVFAGSDMNERREILGRLAPIYVAIEGGPGTAHEASVALARSVILIPVGRSGGHSAVLYQRIRRPGTVPPTAWDILGDAHASPVRVAGTIADLVRAHVKELTDGV